MAPNGLIANLFGPAEGERQDSGMMTDSGSLNFLQQFSFDPNGNPLCICGDPAYPLQTNASINRLKQVYEQSASFSRMGLQQHT